MGKNKLRIYIPDCEFYGGDILCGVVELLVKGSLKSRGIRLLFAGYEHTRWSENSGNNSRTTYSATRIFLRHRFDFAGTPRHLRNEKDAQTEKLEAGVYRWPFSIVLPPNLPPSVVLIHGYIKYVLTAYVDIPMAIDLKKSIRIPVGGELFNRGIYTLPCPPIVEQNKKSFLFASGKLSMTATMLRKNFFAREAIPIHLAVANDSTKHIDAIKLQLRAHYVFRARNRQTFSTMSPPAWKQKIEKVIEKKTNQEIDLLYHLPEIEPSISTIQAAGVSWEVKLIQVHYILRVRLDIPAAVDLSVDFPINVMKLSPRYPVYYLPIGAPQVYTPVISDGASVPPPPVSLPPPSGQIYGPPPPSAPPAYPEIQDYKYPVENQAILVELGTHEVDKDDHSLLDI